MKKESEQMNSYYQLLEIRRQLKSGIVTPEQPKIIEIAVSQIGASIKN